MNVTRRRFLLGTTALALAGSPLASTRDDLAAFRSVLFQQHVAPFRDIAQSALEAAIVEAQDAVGDPVDAYGAMRWRRLLAQVGDSHTDVELPELETARLPFEVRAFDEGYFVVAAVEELASLIGTRLEHIDGESTGGLIQRLAHFVPHRIEAELERSVAALMTNAAAIRMAGVGLYARLDVRAGFSSPARKKVTSHLLGRELVNWRLSPLPAGRLTDVQIGRVPRPWLDERPQRTSYWCDRIDERTAHLRYRRCAPDPSYSTQRLREDLSSLIASGCSRVVMDVRGNDGGNVETLLPIVELFTSGPWSNPGAFRVLTDARTYSSGCLTAVLAHDQFGAVVVGTSPGQSTNHDGEVRDATLPSGRRMRFSTREVRARPNDPDGYRARLEPDVEVRLRYADYRVGIDTVLAAARDLP